MDFIPHTIPENIIITKNKVYPYKFNTPYHKYMKNYISENHYYDFLKMINNSNEYKEWADAYKKIYGPIGIICLFIPIIGVFGLTYYMDKKVKRVKQKIDIAINRFNKMIDVENCGFSFVENNILNADYLSNSYICFKYNHNLHGLTLI